jgi:hypothetical protein
MKYKKFNIAWSADRTILNSVYDFPFDRRVISFSEEEKSEHKSIITTKSKLTILYEKLTLLFDDNKVIIRQHDTQQWNDFTLIYYLIYKTFIHYNCTTPVEQENISTVRDTNEIIFRLERYVKKSIVENGRTGFYMDTEPCDLVLNKQDIIDYLHVVDETVWLALCYYLLGCDTFRYFLVEFYKCLEVVRSHFGNEKKMKDALQTYGFRQSSYEETKKLANDRRNPLSISRHAPFKGCPIKSIDTKWLFDNPFGKKTFETGETACRNTIDAYIKFRVAAL